MNLRSQAIEKEASSDGSPTITPLGLFSFWLATSFWLACDIVSQEGVGFRRKAWLSTAAIEFSEL